MLLGLTGSAIAWLHEIDSFLNPELIHVTPLPGARARDAAGIVPEQVQAVLDRLSADPGYGRPTQLMLPERADEVFIAWYRQQPRDGGSWPRLAYSSHRSLGYFAAPVLLLLGFSGWYFNLPEWVLPIA